MASWESNIRKKVLEARPFEPQANWDRMGSLLAELPPPAAPARRPRRYWLLAAALAFLMVGAAVIHLRYKHENIVPLPKGQEEGVYVKVEPEEAKLNFAPGPKTAVQPPSKQALRTGPALRRLAPLAFEPEAGWTVLSEFGTSALGIPHIPHDLPPLQKEMPNPSLEGAELISPLSSTKELTSRSSITPALPLSEEPLSNWKLGFYLNTEHSSSRLAMGDGSNVEYLFVNSGAGLGLMRRFKDVWEAGIRLDFAEVFLPAKTPEEGYADLLGVSRTGRLSLRRYLRKDQQGVFQPYAHLSTGLHQVSMDYLKINSLGTEPPDPPVPSSPKGGWKLPGSVDREFSALATNPAYEVERYLNYNQYLYLQQSLELGAEFRIMENWSFNLESGFNGRLALQELENAQLEAAVPRFYLNHRLGLQFAF